MRKKLFSMFLCFALIVPGSSFIAGLNAQTITKRTARTPLSQKNPAKAAKIDKSASAAKVAAKKDGAAAAGDPCETATPIAFGQPLVGALSTGDCVLTDGTLIDFYSFNGVAGQPIYISMSSSTFDTYLFLFDDAGDTLIENDDSGDDTDSRIPVDGGVITLPYTGTYFIGANSFDVTTGGYSISLDTDTTTCAATPIGFNQTVNGTLAETDCAINIDGEPFFTDRYTFSGTAGQQISVAMNSAAVDAYLILYTPSGDGTLEDNDSGGGTNARIPASGTITLPETGVYTIEASSFNSFETGAYSLTIAGPTVTPTARTIFDYDGDGKADVSVFRPSQGAWYIRNSGTANSYNIQTFGFGTDQIVPADFDGDGKTDIAVFRASEGNWYVLQSTTNTPAVLHFGTNGDVPVATDFDGDDKADFAVYRASTGTWWIYQSTNGATATVQFGLSGDTPLADDFDGDGKSDIAVFRPSTGVWYRINSSNSQTVAYQFGLNGDIPTPADFDGDGKTDIAVFRPSNGTWYIANSSNATFSIVNFGLAEDKPVAADFDGDGKADIAVFRPSTNNWYLLQSTAGFGQLLFGASGDVPTPGAYYR